MVTGKIDSSSDRGGRGKNSIAQAHIVFADFSSMRKVDNVDFGFSFRTPGRIRRSISRISNSSLHNAEGPNRISRDSSAAQSQRSTSRASTIERDGRTGRKPSTRPEVQDVRSNKRRRLTANSSEDDPFINEPPPTRRASRTNTSSMFAIAEDQEELEALPGEENDSDLGDATINPELPDSLPDEIHEKENTGPGDGKPPAKRKKRKSIGQQSTIHKKKSSDRSRNASHRLHDGHSTISPLLEEESEPRIRSDHDKEHIRLHETSSQKSSLPSRQRKKRKSVVLVRKKRRSSEGVRPQLENRTLNSGFLTQQGKDVNEQSGGPTIHRNIRPPLSVTRSSPVIRSIEAVDDASDEEYIDEDESPEPPTPAPIKKWKLPITARTASSKGPGRTAGQTNRSRKSTFPILTHRITSTEALPTIRGEEEDLDGEGSDDASTAVHTYSHRAAPNVADVIAQICRETIETTIERMETEAEKESWAIRQRKRSALEAFGADLDNRLFDVSAAAEDRLDLEARVRKLKREKTDLQTRWLEVRSERERTALRCDRLRHEHWENEYSRQDRWSISEAARKAELELDQKSPEEEEALEYLLRSVAEEVTITGGGGLLNRLKSMNAQLEKIAGMLEGRAG